MGLLIVRGVFMVGGPDLSDPNDACIYLVDGEKAAALIDAGAGEGLDEVLANIERTGVALARIKYLILTHCHVDHSGGLPEIKERLGLTTIGHAADAEILKRGNDPRTAASWYGIELPAIELDVAFADREYRVDIGDAELICTHAPGHSPGSIVVYLDRDGKRILFGQDVHGPILPVLGSDPDKYQESLKLMLDLQADVLCEGHFGIYKTKAAVEKYIRSYMTR